MRSSSASRSPGASDSRCFAQRHARRQPLLDLGVAILVRQVDRQPEPLTGPGLDPVVARGVGQQVGGDPEQPRERRTVPLIAEAAAVQPRARERLRRQVAGRPLDPPAQPAVDRFDVAHVQLCERRRIAARLTKQDGVTALLACATRAQHSPTYRTTTRICIRFHPSNHCGATRIPPPRSPHACSISDVFASQARSLTSSAHSPALFRDQLGTKSVTRPASRVEKSRVGRTFRWAGQDSNLGATDYESAALTN